jgi:hypothetical protein
MTEATLEMQEVVIEGVTKYTISYPLTDESGQPMLDRNQKPRYTNLIADSPAELVKKQAQANLEVARALERSSRRFDTLSSRTPTKKAAATELKGKPLTQEETVQVGLDMQDPRKAAGAVQRVVESVVPVKEITNEVQRQGQKIDLSERDKIALRFIGKNKDTYLAIEANNAMLNQYLVANDLAFTVENLEIAAATLGPKLVPPRSAPKNDPPPSPDNASPDNAPPNPGNSPPERRAPVGGIRNDQASASPAGNGSRLTRQQALDMLYKEPAKYEAWMRDPVKNKILNDALRSR